MVPMPWVLMLKIFQGHSQYQKGLQFFLVIGGGISVSVHHFLGIRLYSISGYSFCEEWYPHTPEMAFIFIIKLSSCWAYYNDTSVCVSVCVSVNH